MIILLSCDFFPVTLHYSLIKLLLLIAWMYACLDTFTTSCEQPCSSSPKEDDIDISVIIYGQGSAGVGDHSFSMNCTVAGINDSNSLSIAHQWYKDNHSIQGAGLSTLHFSALTLMDAGSYVCEVSIRSSSQRNGIIRSTLPYILNISSE